MVIPPEGIRRGRQAGKGDVFDVFTIRDVLDAVQRVHGTCWKNWIGGWTVVGPKELVRVKVWVSNT